MSFNRQSLLLTQKNELDSRISNSSNSNRSRNEERFFNRVNDINRDVFSEKVKAYIAEKQKTNNNDDSENQKNDEKYSDDENNKNYYFEKMRYMNYYESYNVSENDDNVVYLIISEVHFTFKCKQCDIIFSFNNKLHQYIKKCFIIKKIDIIFIKTRKLLNEIIILQNVLQKAFTIIDENTSQKTFFNNLKSFAKIYVIFTIKIIKTFFLYFIIEFTVNSVKNIDINYDFRDWEYIKVKITLSFYIKFDFECLNIDSDIILMNRDFFQTQTQFNIAIRKMTTFISIRELSINKHMFDEYIIVDMYLSEKNKDDNLIIIKIIRETHLIDDLKANMLIDNDCIDSKKIIVNSADDIAHIDSCDVIVAVNVKISRIIVQISVHARKTIVVSSQFEMTMSVHYIIILSDRDFLFESTNQLNLSLYAHLINVETHNIVIRNDENKVVQLSRNCRVDRMIEVNFLNVFLMKLKMHDLVIKSFKASSKYKSSWFKKIIVAFAVAVTVINVVIIAATSSMTLNTNLSASMSDYSKMTLSWNFSSKLIESWKSSTEKHFTIYMNVLEIVSNLWFITSITISIINVIVSNIIFDNVEKIILTNKVIIHRFNDEAVETFRNLINDYSDLFIDIDFVELSENNWMRILLKTNWEFRIFDKTKIYSLNAQDKTLVDVIFDQLHEIEKLSWTKNSTSFNYLVFCVWKIVNDEQKKRVIVDIRDLNIIIQSDVYSLS